MYVSSGRGLGSEAAWQQGAAITESIAPFTGPAAPFVEAAGKLVSIFAQIFSGCGQTCVQATQYANQASSQLDAFKAQYFAQPVHYQSAQTAYLNAVGQILTWLQQMCSNPALGSAGQRCISERLVRGGPAPWCTLPNHVGCDYWTNYYDSVANDTKVVPDPNPVSQAGSAVASGVESVVSSLNLGSLSGLLLPGALILGAVLLFGGDD